MFELATPADADHASQFLDYLADYHPAITRTDSDRAELILTLPAENAHHAEHHALALVKATGHRPIRVDVLLAETYDRETSGRHGDSAGRPCDPPGDARQFSAT